MQEFFFKNVVGCHVFSDCSSQPGQINKLESLTSWCMGLCFVMAWALVLTCTHLLSPEMRWPEHTLAFGVGWLWARCSIWLTYSQTWFICMKNGSCRWSLPLRTSAGASDGTFVCTGAGWPCAAPCSLQCPWKQGLGLKVPAAAVYLQLKLCLGVCYWHLLWFVILCWEKWGKVMYTATLKWLAGEMGKENKQTNKN